MFFSLLFPVLGSLSGVSSRSDSDHGTCRAPFDPWHVKLRSCSWRRRRSKTWIVCVMSWWWRILDPSKRFLNDAFTSIVLGKDFNLDRSSAMVCGKRSRPEELRLFLRYLVPLILQLSLSKKPCLQLNLLLPAFRLFSWCINWIRRLPVGFLLEKRWGCTEGTVLAWWILY